MFATPLESILSPTFPRLIRVAGACLLAALSAPAQGRVWIVDAANGPGAHFTSLPPAITAATDGDQIRVRKGSYFLFGATSKALAILGEPGAGFTSSTQFAVADLPAGRDFVLKGFASASINKPQVVVRNCAGRVLLDRLSLSPFPGQITFGPAISIENSALVTVTRTSATGSPALRTTASTVHVTDSDLTGANAQQTFQLEPSHPALEISGGKLELTNCQLRGGDGLQVSLFQVAAPSPALAANAAALRIARIAACFLSAGTGTNFAAPALRGTLGSLRVDPKVVLTPYRTAPKIEGTIAVETLRLPALTADGAPPAGVVRVELSTRAGDLVLLFVSPPGDVLPLPAFGGDLGLDLARTTHVLTTAIGASEHLALNVPVPNDPNLRGSNWVWQGLAGTPASAFLLTNRANYTLD